MIVIAALPPIAEAGQSLSHDVQTTEGTGIKATGASITIDAGQEDLTVTASTVPGYRNKGINKEMWLKFDNGRPQANLVPFCWIEVGQKKGEILNDASTGLSTTLPNQTPVANMIPWSGHFIGYAYVNYYPVVVNNVVRKQLYEEFHASPIGPQNPTGPHTYEIRPLPPLPSNPYYRADIYIDGKQVRTITLPLCVDGDYTPEITKAQFIPQYSTRIDVGIENKDTDNSFRSGTGFKKWKYYDLDTQKLLPVPSASKVSVVDGPVMKMKQIDSQFTTSPDGATVIFTHK